MSQNCVSLKNISPCELVALANTVALIIAKEFTTDELAVLGTFICTVGDTVSTLAAQQQFLDDQCQRL